MQSKIAKPIEGSLVRSIAGPMPGSKARSMARLVPGPTPKLTPESKNQRWILPLILLACGASFGLVTRPSLAQATPAAASSNRFIGTIIATSPGSLVVKADNDGERKVTVPNGIRLQRIAPGEKDLSKAAVITFGDLAVGDRVLIRLAPEPATDPVTALSIIAIPQADMAQKQAQEREDWTKRGVGGLVKSVDAGTGIIVIVSGAGLSQKITTLHTTPATDLRRYAPDSVSFDQAKAAPLSVIQVGDQVRARGEKSADGLDVKAEAIVSGSFRNISGTLSAVNASAMTITLKDLITKQNVTVHVGPDVQMRKLPDTMAKMLSNMTKPAASAGGQRTQGSAPPSAPSQPAQGDPPASANGGSSSRAQNGAGGQTPGAARGSMDLQQMISRAPAIHLADLQKGDAVMLVSTQGTGDVTAVTLLAGVEPLLEAPAETQNMLLSGWNMASEGTEAAQ